MYPSIPARSYSTRRDESIEHISEPLRADLQKFETGQTWRSWKRSSRKGRSRKRRSRRKSRKNSESKVNDGCTPASLHRLNVLHEPNQLRLPASQSELICKSSKGVSHAGGGGGVERRIESQQWTYPSVLARS